MLCEHYKEALIEAAASEAPPPGGLRSHLDGCAACRATFEQEQAFFASIDAGLRVTANAEVPASLLPHVRARLDEAVASQRHWFQPLIFAAASVVLAIAIFLLVRPLRPNSDNQAKQTPQTPTGATPTTSAPQQNFGAAPQIVSSDVNHPQARHHSTLLRPATSSQPEVIVPADEREAFSRLVVVLRQHREVAVALVTPGGDEKDEPGSLKPLHIERIEVKPLEEWQAETSDGAEKKQ